MTDVVQEKVRIADVAGELAGELAYPWAGGERAACLLVNPHPYMGGTMQNNLIQRLATTLPIDGLVTLRFDYRGVREDDGAGIDIIAAMAAFWKTGHAPQDPTLRDDARLAAVWLKDQVRLPIAVIGYSFGAYAALAMVDEDTPGFIMISPTVVQHDFRQCDDVACPKMIIYGDGDFATPSDSVGGWLSRLPGRTEGVCVAGADHFFRGREPEVVALCRRFLCEQSIGREAAACR